MGIAELRRDGIQKRMNWRSIGFDWNQVRAFLATAEEGSLSAAARALGQTQPTLGRQVAALEEALGVALFDRAGRTLVLTDPGKNLLAHARAMRDAAGRLSLAASGQSQEIAGLVRITATEIVAACVLPPFLRDLRAAAPALELSVVASDQLRDLQRREADIAIRHVRPTQPDLIVRLVCETTASLWAAREYLDRRGRPETTEDAAFHDFIGFGDDDRMIVFLQGLGLPLTPASFPTGSANGAATWAFLCQGLGISVMADHLARRTPGLERVLPGLPPVRFPVYLIAHRELHSSRRIRLVFDRLADFLAAEMRVD
jgi:DNA-binding transcriptional LysR family regulator